MSAERGPFELPWVGVDRGGQPLVLRVAVRRDAARYLEHLDDLVSETPFMLQSAADHLPSLADEKELIDEYGRRDNCVFILALPPGTPGRQPVLGNITMVGGRGRRTEHSVELAMGVSRRAWGRGIGSLLLDVALTWARANPIVTRVGLQVFSTNKVALNLYYSRQFVFEGVMRRFAKWDGQYDDLVGMSIPVGGDA